MTREEMADLTEFIAVVCPQQKIGAMTVVAWYEIVGHLDFDVARNAVIAAKHQGPFVDPSDIIREADRAMRRRAHPSERTVAEAIGQSSQRELAAAPAVPPTGEYLAALDDLRKKQRARDESLYIADRETARRAQDWINYKLTGKLPPDAPAPDGPVPSRFAILPDDPPELRAHLRAQAAAESGGDYPEDWPDEELPS